MKFQSLTTERDAGCTEGMQIRGVRTAKYAKHAKKNADAKKTNEKYEGDADSKL